MTSERFVTIRQINKHIKNQMDLIAGYKIAVQELNRQILSCESNIKLMKSFKKDPLAKNGRRSTIA